MQYKRIVVIAVCVIVLTVIVTTFLRKNNAPYENDYFGKAGVESSFFYYDVIRSKGTPLNEQVVLEDNNSVFMDAKYDGYTLRFSKTKDEDKLKYFLGGITITDPQYKIGKYKIGIGSKLSDLKKAYKNKIPLKDGKYGWVDGTTWVEFEIDNNSVVKSIRIFCGP